MSVYTIPQVVEEKIGRPVAEALVDMFHREAEEGNKSMLSLFDERIARRFEDVNHRVETAVVGVELRLADRLDERFGGMRREFGGLRREFGDLRAELHREMGDFKITLIRWMVSLMVVQSGLMIVLAWASKHAL